MSTHRGLGVRRASTLLVTALLACGSSTKQDTATSRERASTVGDEAPAASPAELCAHARDRLVELREVRGRLVVLTAPDYAKQRAKELAGELHDHIAGHFAEVCVELDPRDRLCVATIDGYVDALVAGDEASFECRSHHDRTACMSWDDAVMAAEVEFGRCHEVIDEAIGAAIVRGQRERYTEPGILGVMVHEPEGGPPRSDAEDTESSG